MQYNFYRSIIAVVGKNGSNWIVFPLYTHPLFYEEFSVMYIGEYKYTLDDKNRVFIPPKLREDLGERFIVCKGAGEFLNLYSLNEWAVFEQKINSLPQIDSHDLKIFFFAGANEVKPDSQGRIVIPQNLKSHAGLTRDVSINGNSNTAQIWDLGKWTDHSASITVDSIKEKMQLFNL